MMSEQIEQTTLERGIETISSLFRFTTFFLLPSPCLISTFLTSIIVGVVPLSGFSVVASVAHVSFVSVHSIQIKESRESIAYIENRCGGCDE